MAQSAIPATGGTATGTGGSVTYTVGQIVFSQITGPDGFIIQGVQQPYEISVITAVENTEDITLECSVYPNPTSGMIRLVIKSFEDDNMIFRLFDINGVLLQDKKIEGRETVISMDNLPSSVYFLKIIKNRKEVKVFKIIKK
jgi:hypothetical protein